MSDSEHEEWLRDRAGQRNPPTKRIVLGGLQADPSGDENTATHTQPTDGDADEDDDDDDESENTDPTDDSASGT